MGKLLKVRKQVKKTKTVLPQMRDPPLGGRLGHDHHKEGMHPPSLPENEYKTERNTHTTYSAILLRTAVPWCAKKLLRSQSPISSCPTTLPQSSSH